VGQAASHTGGGIWNNGVGLKLSAFRPDGILQIEPAESDPNCWNDGAVEYLEDETTLHNKGGVVGCYGGSAEWIEFSAWNTNKTLSLQE